MPAPKPPQFPHLSLLFAGKGLAKFPQAPHDPDGQVGANKANRKGHSNSLKNRLAKLRGDWQKELGTRKKEGKPMVGDRIVLGLKMPAAQLDLTMIEKQFGLELVSEGENGLLLTAAEDLDFEALERVIDRFANNERGGGSAASILEIYGPADGPRLDEVLDETLCNEWPFDADAIMVLDTLIEVPHHPGYVLKQRKRGPKDEAPEEKEARKVDWTSQATAAAYEQWDQAKETRVEQLTEFIRANGGEIVEQSEEEAEQQDGIVWFPDSVLMRVRMSGLGFRDLVLTIPWLVRLERPDELAEWQDANGEDGDGELPEVPVPASDAPRICIIDSGIQEGHRLLSNAIRKEDSQCFIPGKAVGETQDEVAPSGHGTKVAGAVLYPQGPPSEAADEPVAWLQNARVLNGANQFEANQNPLRNLQDIVAIYHGGAGETRLFVHSINAREACRKKRMTAWAALLDTHAHQDGVLFFQSAGNLAPSSTSPSRLGVQQHLHAGREYPAYLLEDSCRIAAPGQSLHAITVGSVAVGDWQEGFRRSISNGHGRPSAFSRSGLGIWDSVKPDVVEFGGDFQRSDIGDVRACLETAPVLTQSTLHGAPGIGRDAGTSFAAPKVAHIAAALQRMYPEASVQLYRALIINSARWPDWAESLPETRRIEALRTIGYGIPDLTRATENTSRRVTLITAQAQEIINGRAMVFAVPVPREIRDSATPCRIRIDVTLAYTAEPRQTRSTRYGYLETWLGWMSSNLEEPLESFINRATRTGADGDTYPALPWMLRERNDWGEIDGASRQKGTAQKDWAFVDNVKLPDQLGIAVQAHKGWNREDNGGLARFALVVSFEAMDAEIPVHSVVRAEIEARVHQQVAV